MRYYSVALLRIPARTAWERQKRYDLVALPTFPDASDAIFYAPDAARRIEPSRPCPVFPARCIESAISRIEAAT